MQKKKKKKSFQNVSFFFFCLFCYIIDLSIRVLTTFQYCSGLDGWTSLQASYIYSMVKFKHFSSILKLSGTLQLLWIT